MVGISFQSFIWPLITHAFHPIQFHSFPAALTSVFIKPCGKSKTHSTFYPLLVLSHPNSCFCCQLIVLAALDVLHWLDLTVSSFQMLKMDLNNPTDNIDWLFHRNEKNIVRQQSLKFEWAAVVKRKTWISQRNTCNTDRFHAASSGGKKPALGGIDISVILHMCMYERKSAL